MEIAEIHRGPPGVWTHPLWETRFPWLAQGVSGGSGVASSLDFALFGTPKEGNREHWTDLARFLGFETVVHSKQVHGARVLVHDVLPPGLHLVRDADGHATAETGILMGVTVADCVPVFLVDPRVRAVALLHAGWRGVVAGVVEEGMAVLADSFRTASHRLHAHLGPAICGECYEVGPEVHRALRLPDPGKAEPVDLRRVIRTRLLEAGVAESRISLSTRCTRCGASPFFSHRRGDPGRQVAFLGIRSTPAR
jgi:hypothetical protein